MQIEQRPVLDAWTALLTLRLQAQIALGQVQTSDLQRATDLLESGKTPKLEGMVFMSVLSGVLNGSAAKKMRRESRIQLEELAKSLQAYPESQGCFQ